MTSNVLLRGGCVLTLGARTPNLAQADVLIEGDVVAEVGPALRARDAEQIDASDTIVMPGFVDTHRHALRSLWRNLGEGIANDRLAASVQEERYEPDDMYAATLISLLGAAEAGITTVVDWSDASGEDGAAEAALQAHADVGLRTVFVHGVRAQAPPTTQLLARLSDAAGPSTTIALGTSLSDPPDHVATAWATARDAGARIHAHRDVGHDGTREPVASRLLAADVTLVHCGGLDEAEADAIARSGAAVSLAPASEMAGGTGAVPIQLLIDRDIRPGLGTDDERLAPGDLFAQMRSMISVQHATVFDRKLAGKAGVPRLMTTRDAIRSATIDGARCAGIERLTGSLEPGKKADIIMLRTDRPNIFPINDPIGAVVWGMDTSNVDRVIVGGGALMREGVLSADLARARALATTARQRVAAAAGLALASPGGER